MGRKSNKDIPEEILDEKPTPTPPVKNKADLISSKIFIKKLQEELKEELKEESISPTIFKAFIASVKRVDTEENYRNIWKTSFKRQ
jgi:hypothetical protein